MSETFFASTLMYHVSMAIAIFLTAFVITVVIDLIAYRRFGDFRGVLSFVTLFALCAFGIYAVYIYK